MRMKIALLALLAVIALPVALAGCGSSDTSTPEKSAASLSLPADAGHVHGIVRSPKGDLLIGTHAGVFTPGADGSLTRIGDAADYMGLALLPAGTLLSSGHPAPESDEPNPLGLRQSRDNGTTWTRVTQVPRDDYHVIKTGGGRIYAAAAHGGAMYAGRAPTAMAGIGDAPSGLIDLAVKPGRGSSLLASTQSGLLRSRDGGRTWTPVGDGVGLLSWVRSDAVFLVDADGAVSMSADDGASWSARGTIGAPPAALLATSASELVAADHEGRILTSDDGGRNWSS